jgi:NTP pyrophosphatase (non-canonical NTP hydrolase)
MDYVQPELPFDYEEFPPLHDKNELAAELGLDAIAALVHETAKEKGFWPRHYFYKRDNLGQSDGGWPPRDISEEAIATKLALVHSEVTEVLEAVRKEQGKTAIVEEMADVIIRLLDLYAALLNTGQVDDSLDDVIQLKMKKNSLRPQLHGNRF